MKKSLKKALIFFAVLLAVILLKEDPSRSSETATLLSDKSGSNHSPDETALRDFLTETVSEATKYIQLDYSGNVSTSDGGYTLFPAMGDENHESVIIASFKEYEWDEVYYFLLSEELPQTIDEMRTAVGEYFSEAVTEEYMKSFARCEAERTGGDESAAFYSVNVTECAGLKEYGPIPRYLEINGRLYRDEGTKGGAAFEHDLSTAEIVEKTEDKVIFIYRVYGAGEDETFTGKGRLVYENGWKYDWTNIIGMPMEAVKYEDY